MSEVLLGDCRERMAAMPENSVDAIVTDPPYGLSKEPDAAEVLRHWLNGDDYKHKGGGFMGKTWDSFVPGPSVWREAYRILKPGGYCLVFAGTRTADLMGMALRLAGFEVRDTIHWTYGSGFPKSMDVSKAIDKTKRRDYVLAAIGLGLSIPGNNLHDWTKAEHSPGDAWWEKFKEHLSPVDWQRVERAVIGRRTTGIGTGRGSVAYIADGDNRDITAPATPEAAAWSGWGTALKPSHEPIIVCRKPLEGTVAANVLKHGTGALNIDASRIATGGESPAGRRGSAEVYMAERPSEQLGRWPANTILTHGDCTEGNCAPDCPLILMDAQSGTTKSTGGRTANISKTSEIYGGGKGLGQNKSAEEVRGDPGFGDVGGASRYFPRLDWTPEDVDWMPFYYQAKAGRREREAGTHNCTCSNEASSESEAPQVATQAETATPPPKATTESTSGADSEWPTSSHGKKPMGDQSQTDTKSITETKTSRTTTPQTSNSLMPPPTSDSTPAANSERASGGSLAASAGASAPSPKNTGISAKKDGHSMGDAAPVTSASLSRKSESGSSGAWCHNCDGLKAGHPTVKPLAVMEWLVRLVTPPGGTVMDPFLGSGTTGCAAVKQGFGFVGVELDADYARIAEARIRFHAGDDPRPAEERRGPVTLEDFL